MQASLRESWLDDMMHVLEGEELGQDAATVEAAFKRHEAISTDVKARVSVYHFILVIINLVPRAFSSFKMVVGETPGQGCQNGSKNSLEFSHVNILKCIRSV